MKWREISGRRGKRERKKERVSKVVSIEEVLPIMSFLARLGSDGLGDAHTIAFLRPFIVTMLPLNGRAVIDAGCDCSMAGGLKMRNLRFKSIKADHNAKNDAGWMGFAG